MVFYAISQKLTSQLTNTMLVLFEKFCTSILSVITWMRIKGEQQTVHCKHPSQASDQTKVFNNLHLSPMTSRFSVMFCWTCTER